MHMHNSKRPGLHFVFHFVYLAFIFGALNVVAGPIFAADTLVVKIRPFRERNIDYTKEYKYQLLELILGKTAATDGPFRIEVVSGEEIAQSRVIELINSNALTLIMAMTSTERERELIPVRIPVYKGLWGYRIFIIKRRDLGKFAKISSEEDLKKLWAGQGHDWPDAKILQANGYRVVTGSSYRGLFAMLEEGRFDYFPRGVNEPWREVEEEKARDIAVEPTLMLHYYAPVYYFVAKNNKQLAERLQRGFEMAIADGSFNHFFNNHWFVKDTLKKANFRNRRIFTLNNPLLSAQTPLDRPELWYKP